MIEGDAQTIGTAVGQTAMDEEAVHQQDIAEFVIGTGPGSGDAFGGNSLTASTGCWYVLKAAESMRARHHGQATKTARHITGWHPRGDRLGCTSNVEPILMWLRGVALGARENDPGDAPTMDEYRALAQQRDRRDQGRNLGAALERRLTNHAVIDWKILISIIRCWPIAGACAIIRRIRINPACFTGQIEQRIASSNDGRRRQQAAQQQTAIAGEACAECIRIAQQGAAIGEFGGCLQVRSKRCELGDHVAYSSQPVIR